MKQEYLNCIQVQRESKCAREHCAVLISAKHWCSSCKSLSYCVFVTHIYKSLSVLQGRKWPKCFSYIWGQSFHSLVVVVVFCVMHAHYFHANLFVVVWLFFFFLSSSPWSWSLVIELSFTSQFSVAPIFSHQYNVCKSFPCTMWEELSQQHLPQHLLSSFPSSLSFVHPYWTTSCTLHARLSA